MRLRNVKVLFSDDPGVKELRIIFTTDKKRVTTKNYLAHFELPLPVKYGDVWYSELTRSDIERIFPIDLPDTAFARLELYPRKDVISSIEITL
jgi:hypothetical protein